MRLRRFRLPFQSFNISAQKLESERSESFAVSISLQSKAIRSYFRVRGTVKYPSSSGKSSRSWSKLRCAYAGLGYSFNLKVKWSYILAQKLKSERSKSFAVSILLQTKDVGGQFRVPGNGKYPPSSGKFGQSWSKLRRAYGRLGYSFSLKVKWGNTSAQKLETECLKGLLCEFRCKPRPSGVSIETQGVENISQIPGNLAEVCQNHQGVRRSWLIFQS